MSLEIVRSVAQAHPDLLRANLGATCYQHTVYVIEQLRKAGHAAFHVCKTRGEGQYTPPGFQPRTVAGLDGKPYVITGVSHDALWCDGKQYDTLAKANDSDSPIYEPDGSPMIALPVWNEIPQQYWRPNNPPLPAGPEPTPVPVPPPAPSFPAYPGDAVFDAVGDALFADYAHANHPPDAQMGRWFGRVVYDWLAQNEPTLDASIKKHQKEWRALLG